MEIKQEQVTYLLFQTVILNVFILGLLLQQNMDCKQSLLPNKYKPIIKTQNNPAAAARQGRMLN